MRKIKRKKRELYSGVRVDNTYSNLLRQFNLGKSSSGEKRRKFSAEFLMKPSSILYICCFFGLSIGIGSAFADKDLFPTEKPLDQPVQQGVLNEEHAKDHRSSETKSQEIYQQDPKSSAEKVQEHPQGSKEPIQRNEKSLDSAASGDKEANPNLKESKAIENDSGSLNNKPIDKPIDKPIHSKTIKKQEEPVLKDDRKSASKNAIPSIEKQQKNTVKESQVGGKLPATAGDYLNYAFVGLLLFLVGIGLLKQKKERIS